MNYLKIIEPLLYIAAMYYSLLQLAEGNDIYMYAFAFIGSLCGFVTWNVNCKKLK